MTRINILALGPQEVIPPVDGGKEGIHGALKALAQKAQITYAYPAADNSMAVAPLYREMEVQPVAVSYRPCESLATLIGATLRGRPFKFEKYSTTEASRQFQRAIGDRRFDAILCFHPHTVGLAFKLSKLNGWNIPIVLREHNIEFQLVDSFAAAQRGLRRLAARFFAELTRCEEIRIWKKVSATAFLTDHDLSVARGYDTSSPFVLAPEGIPLPARREVSKPAGAKQLLILLNPRATQSVSSLKQFIHQHWLSAVRLPSLQGFTLAITGVGMEQLASLVALSTDELENARIKALGFVPSLVETFAASIALISPTYVGGGIRKKILEAMANQLPVIASPLDIESCSFFRPRENILRFDTTDDFVASVEKLGTDDGYWLALSSQARSCVETHADWNNFADIIVRTIEEKCRVGVA